MRKGKAKEAYIEWRHDMWCDRRAMEVEELEGRSYPDTFVHGNPNPPHVIEARDFV